MLPIRFTHYHSRTGIVYNVTPRAVGIIINKIVGNRYIEKRVNIRIEHVRHSKCRQEFLDRVKRNTAASAEAKKSGRTLIFSNPFPRTLSNLLAQNVSLSSACQYYPAPVTPSRRTKTRPRQLSLFLMRLLFDFCTGTVCIQSNRIRALWSRSDVRPRSSRIHTLRRENLGHIRFHIAPFSLLCCPPRPSKRVLPSPQGLFTAL